MTNVRIRFVAVLLGVLGCLVAGSTQSFAAPAPDAAPLASPASEEACGELTASVSMSSVNDEMWAAGSVRAACAGWDQLCVKLLNSRAEVVARRCVGIPAGSGASTSARSTCVTGWYYGQTAAYDGAVIKKQISSARKHFTC